MIRQLFLPDAFGSYYLFTQHIIAFEITKTHVYATVATWHKRKKTIERFLTQEISGEGELRDLTIAAIKLILEQVPSYTKVFTTISSNFITLKELTLPFTDINKIKMVAPFEVEASLPFSLHDAVMDGIITHQANNQSNVLIFATQKKYIDELNALFEAAGVLPSRISVDLLELYGLFTTIPEYSHVSEPIILLYPQGSSTRVALVIEGKLKNMRVIPYGMSNQNNLLKELVITLEGFAARYTQQGISQIIALIAPENPLIEKIAHTTEITTHPFLTHKIAHNKTVMINPQVSIPPESITSLATALSSPLTLPFNLQINKERISERLLIQQLVVGCSLIILIFISFSLHSFFTLRKLRNEITKSEKEVASLLKKEFNLPEKITSLDELNKKARDEVNKRAHIWSQLSPQSRQSVLVYLQELSTRINREELGLSLKKLTINEDTSTMRLEGSVKGWDELNQLEKDLVSSPFFKNIPHLQELNFAITIALDKDYEEHA